MTLSSAFGYFANVYEGFDPSAFLCVCVIPAKYLVTTSDTGCPEPLGTTLCFLQVVYY